MPQQLRRREKGLSGSYNMGNAWCYRQDTYASTIELRVNVFYQIERPSLQRPIILDIDHPTPSPELSARTSPPAQSPPLDNDYAATFWKPQLSAHVWTSPAFLKRNHLLATDYDPFAENEFPDNDRRKRTKFGRSSGQWRFVERTPSPEKDLETSPFETARPSRLPVLDRLGGDEARSRSQQAHSPGSTPEASSVASSDLTDRSELEFQSEADPSVKDTFGEKVDRLSTSPIQANGENSVSHDVTEDGNVGNVAINKPITQHTNREADIPTVRGLAGSTNQPTSLAFKTRYVSDEISQHPAPVVQASSPVPIEISSSVSSSASENDQESDEDSDQDFNDASDQEFDSLFDEQSESEQGNAAVYSGPVSDVGFDGSVFSRPPPSAEPAPPPSPIKIPEKEQEINESSTDNARGDLSPLQSVIKRTEVDSAEEPSIRNGSVKESSLSEDEGLTEDVDVYEDHDAAQQRASIQLSSDHLGSLEARELDDEAEKGLAASQILTSDRGSWKDVNNTQDESTVERFSSKSPLSSDPSKRRRSQEDLALRSQECPDDRVTLPLIHEKSRAESSEQSLSSNPENKESSEAFEAQDIRQTSLEEGPLNSAVRQNSSALRQQENFVDAKLTREDAKSVPSPSHKARDRAEKLNSITSAIEKTAVEVIDLESGDEDTVSPQGFVHKGLEIPGEHSDSEFTPTHKAPADTALSPFTIDARNEQRKSTDEPARLSSSPDSTEPVFKPPAGAETIAPTQIPIEPNASQEVTESELQGSGTQPPVTEIEEHQEELRIINEAPVLRSHEVDLRSRERQQLSEEELRSKQPATAEPKLKPISESELPSTVPDSVEHEKIGSHLLTPNSTQQTSLVYQSSSVSLHSVPGDGTLPTPRLTQGTFDGIVPMKPLPHQEKSNLTKTLEPPKKTSAFIERLKAMRKLSSQSPKPRSSDASILDPWFAPRRVNQVVPDSEDGSEAESSPEPELHANIPKLDGRDVPQTLDKPLAKSFIRSPSQPKHFSSVQSSPQYLPPSQPPPPGFRTNLSYFVPLATLPSHFATTVDVLAIALSSTPVSRATSGPKDYNQSLYITDPSSLAFQHSITTAQIFRPNNRCFPIVERGQALLLRDFKVQPFQKRLLLLSTESSAWAIFCKGADVQIRGPPVEFGAEERGFARGLWDWWASLGDDVRKRLEDAVPEHKKPNGTVKTSKAKEGVNKRDVPVKKEEIQGLGVHLPGSQIKNNESIKERSLALDGVKEEDMVHESIEAPRRVLRARGAKGTNGRSESARESRFGTVFTGGLGEPDETQGSTHELRDGKAYRAKRR